MTSYIGRHADLYDLFYADKPYRDEAAFVHHCLQTYGSGGTRRLLELACGTGSHALALAELGYSIVATDYSADMLAHARAKGNGTASVDFRYQDMRDLNLSEAPFDAAVCLFDSLGYVVTNDALARVLRGVYRHVRPGGLFVFEFWHAGAMLSQYDSLRVRRWHVPEGEILRISETALDVAQQTAQVTFTIYEHRTDGTYSRLQETQTNRYFLVQEMAGWLAQTGFTPLKWFAGFRADETIDANTWHIVAVARRNGEPRDAL